MGKYRYVFFTSLILSTGLNAQSFERCSFNKYIETQGANQVNWLQQYQATHEEITRAARESTRDLFGEVIRIPVVIHVIYENGAQNISDALIDDQITILNQDYRRQNADSVLTRDEFLPVAGDVGIEFFLAETDPDGNPTNGVTRTETTQTSFWLSMTDMKSSTTGGHDAWPIGQYLNIWVCNMSIPILNIPFILGFATPPNGAPNWPDNSGAEQPQEDGVVIHYEVFGSHPDATGTLATVNKGRTATHEIGHYLGLRHIWGDGDCTVDDGLLDTPSASQANQQTCDYTTNTCTDGAGDLPDMLENYMDYSDENCLNMFTQQQVSAMRFVIETFRPGLISGIESENSRKLNRIRLGPNPCSTELQLFVSDPDIHVQSVQCFDLTGRKIQLHEKEFSKVFNISELYFGQYFLQIQTDQGVAIIRFQKKIDFQ